MNSSAENNARINVGNGDVSFNGEKIRAGNWTQLNHIFTIDGSQNISPYTTAVNGTVYMDDFRIHPVSASVTSYVYNEWDELTHTLGANNLGMEYEYDGYGRLIKTYSEVADHGAPGSGGFKQTSDSEYRYKNSIGN